MTLRQALYRALSLSNDLRAVRRGPKHVARRVTRKAVLRTSGRAANKLARWLFP